MVEDLNVGSSAANQPKQQCPTLSMLEEPKRFSQPQHPDNAKFTEEQPN